MSFYKLAKFTSSVQGEGGGDHLLDRLRSEQLLMDVLPNSYPRFSGQFEEEDYFAYCRFLESVNGQKLFDRLEKADGRNYAELFRDC